LSPRYRSNLQHRPDGNPDRRSWQLTLPIALLAERSSRRHARSPGEAGGGRSDLCHDNDETDPVNWRTRVGDNVVDPATELRAGDRGSLQLTGSRLPSGDEKLPSDSYQRKSQLGDHREGPERPRRRHMEGFAGRTPAVILEPGVDHQNVGEVKPRGGRFNPVQSTPLRIDQGERGGSMRDGQRKARKSSSRAEVGPALPRLWPADCRQPKRIVKMPLPEPRLLPRAQESELDSLGVGLLKKLGVGRGQRRSPRRMVAVAPMFHVKR
jgi:hypothetical protein